MTLAAIALSVGSLCALPFSAMAQAPSARSLSNDPIRINSYVSDPRAAIIEGVRKFRWVVQEEQPGKLILRLERPDILVLHAVHYDDKSIRFEDIEAKILQCPTPKRQRAGRPVEATTCSVPEFRVGGWRVNLRRGVQMQIQELALLDAQAKYDAAPKPAADQTSTPPDGAAPASLP
jgi:hypothetical protein